MFSQSVKTAFLSVLLIFILLYGFTYIFGPIPFSVNSITTNKSDLFTVEGTGETSGVPDTALIILGVSEQASTVQAAQNQVNAVSNKLTSSLKNLGVKETDIKTTNYSVSPNYDFNSGTQKVTGYSVSQNLEVKIKPIDKANQAIDLATAAGANNVSGVTFVLDDETREKLEEQARKEAIDNAKKKASEITKLAGLRLGKIVSIYESSGSIPPQPFLAADSKATLERAGGEPTQITPGENTVRITVSLSYQTL